MAWQLLLKKAKIKVKAYIAILNPLPDDKILEWSKLKQIADDILKCISNEKYEPYRVQKILRKGESACYKQLLLFSQCFPQLYIFSASKCGIVS